MTTPTGTSPTKPPAGAEPVLLVENLTVSFPVEGRLVRAVNDVSFEVRAGEVLGVVGESGSGKSVTARSIMRMVRSPGRIDAGRVVLDGEDLAQAYEGRMRQIRGQKVALVFQDPQNALNPVLRIGDQITEALEVHGTGHAQARARALELLAQVGIPDPERTIDLYPHEFSGGMRQRVVIAIALANKPSLLIADEPTTALDVTIQAQILELLVSLRAELGLSIMLITHDMGVVAKLCDRLIVMYGGRVVERGTVREVFERPRHPYTAALLNAVPRLDADRSRSLLAIPGSPPDPSRLPTGCSFHPRCPLAVDRCGQERPPLFPFDGSQEAACWVTAEGAPVRLPAASSSRVPPERRAAAIAGAPALSVVDLRTHIAARRGGLFRRRASILAVDGVTLHVDAGETLGLVGESGCGKSTLARTIVGITKPTSGLISVGGREISPEDAARRRGDAAAVQYVFQDPSSAFNPRRTVRESLVEALDVAGIRGAAARRRAVDLMRRVDLSEEHLDRYPYMFSGGQRQRIGIARALAGEPKVLILDEPVSALDVSIQAQIINTLEEIRDDLGLGYLFIAHDLAVVRHISDRVAVMYLGRIVETGTAAQVYGAPQHPYTVALTSSSPAPDVGERERARIVLRGDLPSPANPPSGCRFRTRCPIGPLHFPDREICKTTYPELAVTANGQRAACHFAGELAVADLVS